MPTGCRSSTTPDFSREEELDSHRRPWITSRQPSPVERQARSTPRAAKKMGFFEDLAEPGVALVQTLSEERHHCWTIPAELALIIPRHLATLHYK